MSEKKCSVQFRGSQGFAFVPMLIFLVFCIIYFVVFKVFDMNALAVGGFLGLLVGALFTKTYDKYWDAALTGIGSSTSVSIVVILLVIGMFTKLMAVSGVSNGFVWLAYQIGMEGGIYRIYLPGVLSDHNGNRFFHRNHFYGIPDPVSGWRADGKQSRSSGRRNSFRSNFWR